MTRKSADWNREFELSGGVLCLDFANTVLKRNQPGRAKDELENYARLVGFAKQTGHCLRLKPSGDETGRCWCR